MRNWDLTISRKISLGFGLFIMVVISIMLFARHALDESREVNQKMTEIYTPSLQEVKDLDILITHSRNLIMYWTYVQSRDDDGQKAELRKILSRDLPMQMMKIDSLSQAWDEDERIIKERVVNNTRRLTVAYQEIMNQLDGFDKYNDLMIMMMVEQSFYPGRAIPDTYGQIKEDLQVLSDRQDELLNVAARTEDSSFSAFYSSAKWFALFTALAGIAIAIVMTKTIVSSVNLLRKTLLYMGKGIYPADPIKVSRDEIGEMAFAVNRLVDGLRKTKEFSTQVGTGNFDAKYEPLSDEDELGFALLKMRDDLAANERLLEQKVVERTNEVVQQKEEVERQREKVTELYKDLTDSINYAKRLQQSILPTNEVVHSLFPESFILYKPKDIVSGDFYWFKSSGSKRMFSAIDCTGHGVPGAFMSLVGHNVLNQVTKVFTRPAQVLNNLNRIAIEVLQNSDSGVQDGMDLAFCTYDPKTLELEYAGAQNPLYLIRQDELQEIKADKLSIGAFKHGEKQFTNHVIQLQQGDCVYVTSDGYADQFGGPKDKKFMRKKMKELLIEISPLHMHEQRERLNSAFVDWKGAQEQVDDILVMGIRV